MMSSESTENSDSDDSAASSTPQNNNNITVKVSGLKVLTVNLPKATDSDSRDSKETQQSEAADALKQTGQTKSLVTVQANTPPSTRKHSRTRRPEWRASVQLGSNIISQIDPNKSSSKISGSSRRRSVKFSSPLISVGSPFPGESDEDDTGAEESDVYTFSDEEDNEEAYQHGKEERKNKRKIAMFDEEDNENNIRFSPIEVAGNYVGLGIPDSDGGAQAISGGTLVKLFQYATSERYSDRNFLDSFILSHRWFSDDFTILRMLKIRYIVHRRPGIHDDWNVFKKTKLAPVRFRCVTFLKTWLQLCPEDFRRSDSLTSQTRHFISHVVGSETPNGQALERALDKALLTSDVGLEFTLPKPPARLAYENTLTTPPATFLDIPAEEIARQIAAREWKMWHSIRKNEFLPGAWTCAEKEKKAPHIVKMIKAGNERTNWTIWEILSRSDIKERAFAINHLINIADHSLKLNNFNATMEIYAGLQSVAIHRLKNTWDLLTPKASEIMKKLEKLWDAEGNWASFRETLAKATPPCIPYLGLFLTDLTFIYDGNPSKIQGSELINFAKWRTVSAVLKGVERFRKCPMNYKKNKQIGGILTPSNLNFDDDEQWNASVALEDKST